MLNATKLKITIIVIAFAVLNCAKGFNYSVIKSSVSSWFFVDSGGLATGSADSYPTSQVLNNQLYVFTVEANGLKTSTYQGFQSFWSFYPTYSVQLTPTMGPPSTTILNSKIYAAWTEVAQGGANNGKPENHVAVTSGVGGWTLVDPPTSCGAVNCLSFSTSQSATNPVLATLNSKLYAEWSETTSTVPNANQIEAAVYNGFDGGPNWSGVSNTTLNRDPEQYASLPQLTPFNSKLYSTWTEVSAPVYGPGANTAMIAASGNNYYIFYSDSLNANRGTVVSSNNGNWNTLGSPGFTPGSTAYNSIAVDNSGVIYVAFQDGANSNSVSVMKFSNNSWTNVGPVGFTSANANYVSLAIDTSTTPNTPYVAFEDSASANKATVMKYSVGGNSWSAVGGAGISTGTAFDTILAIDSSGNLFLAYEDGTLANAATVQEFHLGAWIAAGVHGFSAAGVQYISLKISPAGAPYISYEDSGNGGKATVQKFSAGSWNPVGIEGFTPGQAYYTSLAFDTGGTPYLGFQDANSGNKASVMKFTGSWNYVSGVGGLSNGSANSTTLAIDPTTLNPLIAYVDASLGGEVAFQEYNGSSFAPLNATSSQIRFAVYNGNDVAPQWQYIDGGNNSGINFNKTSNATSSMPAVYQGRLYLAWVENNGIANQVRVAVYGGNDSAPNGFMVDGNSANGLNFNPLVNATGPLAFNTFFNELYLSWSEQDSSGINVIRVKVYNGNDSAPHWTFVDGNTPSGLNANSAINGQWPNFSIFNNNLYTIWIESGIIHAAEGN